MSIVDKKVNVLVSSVAFLGLSGLTSSAAGQTLYGDFNNDGYDDLVIGVTGEDVGDVVNAGAVHVLYGSGSDGGGLSADGRWWHQGSTSVKGKLEAYDYFGSALAVGDFNGDEFDDLAIGAPLENIDDISNAGSVNILYGSYSGLTADESIIADQVWHQDTPGIIENAETGDRFGYALAVGNFNNDGYDDLAIGVPGETLWERDNAGAVNILFGSGSGLTAIGDQLRNQHKSLNLNSPIGIAETEDEFGSALASGDFDHDGFDDLAIGIPGEDLLSGYYLEQGGIEDIIDAGAVVVLYGSLNGLYGKSSGLVSSQLLHQNALHTFGSVEDEAEHDDMFGYVLTVGDFDHNGVDDLAVGVPFEDIGGASNAGAVNVLYGRILNGLQLSSGQVWHQNILSFESAGQNDLFGYALAAGDFDKDGADDLAIGVPWDNVGNIARAGVVDILQGVTNVGLTADGERWHQGRPAVASSPETSDHFGDILAVGDFDHNGVDDLAVGVPFEDIGGVSNAGAVNILYGEINSGLAGDGEWWHQGKPGVKSRLESGDWFGKAF